MMVKSGRTRRYAWLSMLLLLAAWSVGPAKCRSAQPQPGRGPNPEPFMDTISAFREDLLSENADEGEEDFGEEREEPELDLGSSLKDLKEMEGLDFGEDFKNATEALNQGAEQLGLGKKGEEPRPAERPPESREPEPERAGSKERPERVEVAGARRVLRLNLEPRESDGGYDLHADLFQQKIIYVLNQMRKLKKDIIEKNMELDNLFLQVDELRSSVNQVDSALYQTLFKDLDSLSKDLNLLRKGNIYSGDSENILNNITVMEALHGLYVIYRTPFIVLRHNFKLYARFEAFVLRLCKERIPSALRALLASLGRALRGLMSRAYGGTLRLTRATYIHHGATRKALRTYDALMADFLRSRFGVDVAAFRYAGSSRLVGALGALLTRLKLAKHYAYLKHSLLSNSVIAASFLNRNHPPGAEASPDLLYVRHKDHRMLEVLFHIYRLKLLLLVQRLALLAARHLALFCNLFVKDSLRSINSYTSPLLNLSEDSLLRLGNLYVLLRSVSILTLQKVDLFMDYCFNYANRLNPELSILVPRDLSNRIFFVSVIILLTFLMFFALQLLLQAALGLLNSVFSTRSRSSLHSRLRHWYHRSLLRHLVHVLRRGLSSHAKSHRRKHRYHRNFESFHRVIDDGNVVNSDNYRQFKHAQKNNLS